jgi:glutathione S-transferase
MNLAWLPSLLRARRRSPSTQLQINRECGSLALYHLPLCGYCLSVRQSLWWLNLPIELRDANPASPWGEELRRLGGKLQVPCLRIQHDDRVEWLYESTDIIRFLKRRFAR